MVIAPPKDRGITQFWYEARREWFPAWMPSFLADWWTRWRRISGKRNMVLKNGVHPMAVEFADETEMYQFQAYLEQCEG